VDEVIELDRAFWEPCFSPNLPSVSSTPPSGAEVRALAEAYVAQWSAGATSEEITHLLEQAPRVPRDIDVQLLIHAEKTLGSLRDRRELKADLRDAFWKALRVARKVSLGGPAVALTSSNGT